MHFSVKTVIVTSHVLYKINTKIPSGVGLTVCLYQLILWVFSASLGLRSLYFS